MEFRLENVKYKQILDIENLKIPGDKVVCIIGKSGSGKTTLMKLLNGMISPDSGEVYADGDALSKMDLVQLRREVTMLQQTPSIFDGTIRENLNIGRKYAGADPATDEEMKRSLEVVRLNKSLDDDADDLSGGEKQRLAFARVLLLSPKALLLDEPTSALDEDTAHDIMHDVLAKFRENGQSVIMVTHAQAIVDAFGEYVVKLEAGKVVQAGGVNR
ncbi:ATP-binding cassette domain-containing protein [Aciduricibacillus chroicocephali]|uniref:ATP-binding cassette domain-containing protein n=1 Tax=Aciduricibacillus chroicocephali TaxID=3054939 RepID=A0ABY9KV01_9BACI|nr:ATP-binding cassette domain-containing protein [Bacillaceae bacterium 44XB]